MSVSEILERYEEEFIEAVHAKHNLLKLKRKKVIPPDILTKIENVNDDEAKEILYDHLKSHGTVETLREYCEVAGKADGYPIMQRLAEKMEKELPQESGLSVCELKQRESSRAAWQIKFLTGLLL